MKRLLLDGILSLTIMLSPTVLLTLAGPKAAKPRISVIFDPGDNGPHANARTAVVEQPYSLDLQFLGQYPEGDLYVLLEAEGEIIASTQYQPWRQLTFRYTFSKDDYFTALLRSNDGSAEFQDSPRTPGMDRGARDVRETMGKGDPEVAFKFSVVKLRYNKDGQPESYKTITSTVYKVRLSCLSCAV